MKAREKGNKEDGPVRISNRIGSFARLGSSVLVDVAVEVVVSELEEGTEEVVAAGAKDAFAKPPFCFIDDPASGLPNESPGLNPIALYLTLLISFLPSFTVESRNILHHFQRFTLPSPPLLIPLCFVQ